MCGVIGMILKNPSDISVITRLFEESQIRGKHATGVSWVKNSKVETYSEPVPSKEFIKNFDFSQCKNEDSNYYLIGHTRYSTSDLEWNQPIQRGNSSIAHNGVITQVPHAEWKVETVTKNDSELLLISSVDTGLGMAEYSESSVAACILSSDKKLRFFRNGKRPLYVHSDENFVIVMSTQNIGFRSWLSPDRVNFSTEYTVDSNLTIYSKVIDLETEDLQNANYYSNIGARG